MWYLNQESIRPLDVGERVSADDGDADMKTVTHDCSLLLEDYDYNCNLFIN